MKKDLHPPYNVSSVITCSCGASFTIGSTGDAMTTELCSKCHPFYTGKQKLIDTAGRIEKFRQRQAASGELIKRREDEAAKAKMKPLAPEAAVIDASVPHVHVEEVVIESVTTDETGIVTEVDELVIEEITDVQAVPVEEATEEKPEESVVAAPVVEPPAKIVPVKTAPTAKKALAAKKPAAKKALAAKKPAAKKAAVKKPAAKKAPAKKAPAKKAVKKTASKKK